MTDERCPFCGPPAERVFYSGKLALGIWDGFPVSPGHALLVPRRHVPTWFEATPEEQTDLVRAIALAKHAIEKSHHPDGYNVGVNIGEAAGQTVFHLHVHVIPRYRGDVPNPRGGVRHVVPGRGDYGPHLTGVSGWPDLPHTRALVRGLDDPFLPHLVGHFSRATAADIAVAFTMFGGILEIFPHLQDLLQRGGRLRYLTGDYLGSTEPAALRKLLDLEAAAGGAVQCRVFEVGPGASTFHPKAFIISRSQGEGVAFVGSSNVSRAALGANVEWNYRVVSSHDATAFVEVSEAFESLFAHPSTRQLTHEWIDEYARRRATVQAAPQPDEPAETGPEPPDVVVPHSIQVAALAALEATRNDGNKAGLVVLATGLGKTWLAALDSRRPEFRRVLFVAHREEILRQAMATFRRIRPESSFGHYVGAERQPDADVLFASIQTLGRSYHLDRFARDHFDYIVVDEFHHAAARTYRRLIDHFQPKFLLGLTATPERTDGGDLLSLCQENLVYRADLLQGIQEKLLCPFHYFGVPDEVDYRNIPWRNSRFEDEALTEAVATQSRAQNAFEQHQNRAGKRTLGFCVSQRHADFIAAFFNGRGLRAVAVHSGDTSAPRAASLERLQAGELDIIFAVDMFNEGVDLPLLDTVMMLRPTESRIVWLQQFGRGLRTAPDKPHLNVIDYIGNHRTFLLKPQTLLGLGTARAEILPALEKVRAGEFELPPGCEVTYDLEAVNILRALVGTRPIDAVKQRYEEFEELNGVRPTAAEMFHEGYNPRALRAAYGSWLGFVRNAGGLDDLQSGLLNGRTGEFLDALEVTHMTKSYKMLVLLAMLNADALPGQIRVEELARGFRSLATRNARLQREAAAALVDDEALRRDLERNPIDAWVGGRGADGPDFFAYQEGVFRTTFDVPAASRAAFQELVRELVDWRLAEYLSRPDEGVPPTGAPEIQCKVSHSGGRPIIFLPDRDQVPEVPSGWTNVRADGETYEAHFVKVAVNVVRRPKTDDNLLPGLLRKWFGPDAGLSGTRHQVVFVQRGDIVELSPLFRRDVRLERWRSYSREEIPPLFGLTFSRATWNVGFLVQSGHMFLLVTLKKTGTGGNFLYEDRFLAPDLFQWQSQGRTTQESGQGQNIRHHRERGIAVHLFVRAERKTPSGRSSPFVYCGDVRFDSWEGSGPITVKWRLSEPLPDRLRDWVLSADSPDRAVNEHG